jgi:hypothetical protein
MGKYTAFCRFLLAFVATGFLLCGAGSALGQGDLNLSSRIDDLFPDPKAIERVIVPDVRLVPVRRTVTVIETVETTKQLSTTERTELLKKTAGDRKTFLPLNLNTMKADDLEGLFQQFGIPRQTVALVSKPVQRTVIETTAVAEPRKVQLRASWNSSYSYESNANKRPTGAIADWVTAHAGSASLLLPVGEGADTLAYTVGGASQRYDRQVSRFNDAFNAAVRYSRPAAPVFLHPTVRSLGTATVDIVYFETSATSARERGFGDPTAFFVTPAVNWTRGNIPLDFSLCGEKQDAYCRFASISITPAFSFSDIRTQQNGSMKIVSTASARVPNSPVIWSLSASLQGKYFTDVPGGRQDLIAEVVAGFEWPLSDVLTLLGGVRFVRQRSSVAAAEWQGLIAVPTARLLYKFQ